MRLEVLFLALSTLVAAAPTLTKRADPIQDGSAVNGQTFDYVIAGGGLAGVVLASRLTEATDKTVLVIEAGFDESNNVNVTDAGKYQAAFNTRLDWAYKTVNQTSGNGRQEQIRAGRALGGSTTINGMAWSKPHDFQVSHNPAIREVAVAVPPGTGLVHYDVEKGVADDRPVHAVVISLRLTELPGSGTACYPPTSDGIRSHPT